MPPEPFQWFDAVIPLLVLVAGGFLAYAMGWLVERIEPFDFDDEPVEHETPDDARRPEDAARHAPF